MHFSDHKSAVVTQWCFLHLSGAHSQFHFSRVPFQVGLSFRFPMRKHIHELQTKRCNVTQHPHTAKVTSETVTDANEGGTYTVPNLHRLYCIVHIHLLYFIYRLYCIVHIHLSYFIYRLYCIVHIHLLYFTHRLYCIVHIHLSYNEIQKKNMLNNTYRYRTPTI